jgi:hypothetical protein
MPGAPLDHFLGDSPERLGILLTRRRRRLALG